MDELKRELPEWDLTDGVLFHPSSPHRVHVDRGTRMYVVTKRKKPIYMGHLKGVLITLNKI